MAFLDLKTGMMEYVNAGHNPFVIKKKSGDVKLITMKSYMFLGAIDAVKYQSDSLKLEKGDLVYIYTDGVTEAKSKKGEFYGDDRMLETINR